MDLLGTLGAIRDVRDIARRVSTPLPPWATDELAFERHFGVPFAAYHEVTQHLLPEQMDLLERTIDVNPEAAVLWILAMEKL